MISVPSFRLLPALCILIIVTNKKCTGLSPLAAASRFRAHRNTGFQRRIRCFGFPDESIELTLPNVSDSSGPLSPETTTKGYNPKRAYSWIDRVYQLQEYKEIYGDLRVPKRYPNNPGLGNWVNKQRVQYRRFLANETPCSMTEEKVAILNQMGFCWNGTSPKSRSQLMQENEDKWWSRLEEFRVTVQESSGEQRLSAPMDRWLKQQRIEYEAYKNGLDGFTSLDDKKVEALRAIDPDWWKSFHQRQWEQRFQELIAYKNEHGDCCVPINYAKNKKLANWVSNCRKQYRLRKAGEANNMSQERIDQLNAIGFVWDRWEFQFEQITKLHN